MCIRDRPTAIETENNIINKIQFESGHSLGTGKPKGSSNKSIDIFKKNVSLLLQN